MNVRWLAVLAALVLLTARPSAAEEGSWDRHMDAARRAASAGDAARAEAELQAALALVQGGDSPDRRLETTLFQLGGLYEEQGRTADALPMYELWVAAGEVRLGREAPELLPAWAAAGRVALRLGSVPTAAVYLERYAAVATSSGAAEPAEEWRVLALLARSAELQDKNDEALGWQRRVVGVMAGDEHLEATEAAAQLAALAELEVAHGSVEAAVAAWREAAARWVGAAQAEAAGRVLAEAARLTLDAGHAEPAEALAADAVGTATDPGVRLEARAVLADVAWQRCGLEGARVSSVLDAPREDPAIGQAAERLADLAEAEKAAMEPVPVPEVAERTRRQAVVAAVRGDVAGALAVQRELVQLLMPERARALVLALDDLVALALAAGSADAALDANTDLMELIESTGEVGAEELAKVRRRQVELLRRTGQRRAARQLERSMNGP